MFMKMAEMGPRRSEGWKMVGQPRRQEYQEVVVGVVKLPSLRGEVTLWCPGVLTPCQEVVRPSLGVKVVSTFAFAKMPAEISSSSSGHGR